jgi:hypothetical protein
MAVAAVFAALPACASQSYFGIPLAADTADAELQSLANRARAGDKHAQLELGIRFEEGAGVPVDLGKAIKLYRYAASDTGGARTIFVPNGAGVAATTVKSGPLVPGLPAARLREQQAAALKILGYPDKLWPKSFDEARRQSLRKLSAVIAICEQRGELGPLCGSPEYKMLHEAAKFESRFRACRVKFRWRGAAEDPYEYSPGSAADKEVADDVRECMMRPGLIQPGGLSRDSVQSIWLASYIAAKFFVDPEFSEDSPEGRDFFYGVIRHSYELPNNSDDLIAIEADSIMGHALLEMAKHLATPYIGPVGVRWWLSICLDNELHSSAFERSICLAIYKGHRARSQYDYERYGHF